MDGSYMDWPAILGGSVVAIAVGSVFAGFGAALGLSAISMEPGEGSGLLAVILSTVWIVISLVSGYAAGGYIAGRMRRRVDGASADEVTARDGMNGLVVWGVGIVVSVFLLGAAASSTVSAVGSVAGTAVSAAGSAVGGAAEGVMSAAGALVPDDAAGGAMSYVSDTLLRPGPASVATADAATLARETTAILGNVATTGEISDAERSYLVSAVSARTGLTDAEAGARVDQAVSAAQSARAEAGQLATEATQAAIDAAEAARIAAILTAFILAAAALVAGASGYMGAVVGGRHRDEGRMFAGFAYRR